MEKVLVLTGDELKMLIKEAVQEGIANIKLPEFPKVSEDDLIEIDEVCQLLKVSKTTIFALRRKGKLQYYRIPGSRLVRYSRNEAINLARKIVY